MLRNVFRASLVYSLLYVHGSARAVARYLDRDARKTIVSPIRVDVRDALGSKRETLEEYRRAVLGNERGDQHSRFRDVAHAIGVFLLVAPRDELHSTCDTRLCFHSVLSNKIYHHVGSVYRALIRRTQGILAFFPRYPNEYRVAVQTAGGK